MIYWRKMCVSVLVSHQKCPHSQLVYVELKGALDKVALLMLQDGRRTPHTIRQATFQLHNDTQTQRSVLCQDKGCSLTCRPIVLHRNSNILQQILYDN